MDENQIRLYIENNIKPQEPDVGTDPRLALELNHFANALVLQSETLNRQPTPTQIEQAWKNWKLERFIYVSHTKTFTSENIQKLADLAKQRVQEIAPDDPRFTEQIPVFSQAYARQLQHLGKQPLPAHIDAAWNAWVKGFRF